MKLAIVYYSESGNTKQAAEYVAEGMKKAGAEVGLFELDKIDEAFVQIPSLVEKMLGSHKRRS